MKEEHISDLMIERYLLNELPEKQITYINILCKQMPDLQERIEALKKSNEEIFKDYPENTVVPEINRKLELERSYSKNKSLFFKKPVQKRVLIPSLAFATAIISLIFIIPIVRTSLNYIPTDHSQFNTRIKGSDSKIFIYQKKNDAVEVLQNNSNAKKGDLLQIAYISTRDKYGIILSIDGRGTTTLHYPPDLTGSAKIDIGKKILLPNSYELDDAPYFEKFFFITSEHELDVSSVFRSAQLLANNRQKLLDKNVYIIDENESINQTSVLIKKVK